MVRLSLVAAGLFSARASVTGHPVENVITLMKGLAQKAEAEGKSEEVSYTKFARWCANSIKDLSKTIVQEKDTLENLESDIASHDKNIKLLSDEISVLDGQLLKLDEEAGAAKKVRDDGEDVYNQEKQALGDTIKAIKDAVDILQNTRAETDTGLLQARTRVRALMALVSYRASDEQREALEAFVDAKERPDVKARGDRADHVKGYAFKSDSVIELLKGLSLQFEDELVQTNTEFTNAINSYDLAKRARDNLIQAKKDSKATKGDEMGSTTEDLNAADAAHKSTSDDLAADSESLSTTKGACNTKRSEWEERSATRAREIEAMETAISILAKVTGVRTEAPGNPVPPASPAFLQISDPKAQKALRILRQEAKAEHSKALARLADDVDERVKHGDGAFDQVVNAVQKMIFHLQNEQKEEDDHKNWCDQELSTTDKSIKSKTDKVEELTLKINNAQARAAALAEDVRAADEMAGKIQAHMKEATEIRSTGREENKLAVEDAEAAQTALANAAAVLKDFYKSSGGMQKEAWEFLQGTAPLDLPATPSTWDSGYTRVADPAAQPQGIVAVLEKVSANFAQMESETNAQEATDQDAFEQEIKANKIELARRREESEQKAAEQKRTLEKQRSMEAARKSVSGELEATEQYLKDLQPACVEGSSTYDDRKAARGQEMDALKQAQDLLQNAFEAPKESAFLSVRRPSAVGALRTD